MGRLINDPESIHHFREQINQAIDDLQARLRKTESAIQEASASWQDRKFKEFQENFERDKERIIELQNVLHHYSDDVLYKLEQRLNEYLDVPMRF